jgi:hypothetical protein
MNEEEKKLIEQLKTHKILNIDYREVCGGDELAFKLENEDMIVIASGNKSGDSFLSVYKE